MPKSYTEGSCQTIQVDPENHLKKYNSLGVVASNSSIQTKESCNVDLSCTKTLTTRSPKDDDRDEDLSDDDSSSEDQQQELQHRLNPNRPEDFKTLRQELVQWRRREERKITIFARTEENRQEMKKLLLKKEAHILRKIGELQSSATDKLKTDKIEQMITLMGQPKQMADSNGSIIIVDTPETRRAREMKAMNDDLNAKVEKGESSMGGRLHNTLRPCLGCISNLMIVHIVCYSSPSFNQDRATRTNQGPVRKD